MDRTQLLIGVAVALFSFGLVGVIVRRHVLVMLMCMELMLNGVNLSLVTFAQQTATTVGARYSRLLVPGGAGFAVLLGVIVASVWRPLPSPVGEIGQTSYGIAGFSVSFLNDYWLLFELTSVLLVAAIVAALAVIGIGRRASHG